jgi:hypothetical protein
MVHDCITHLGTFPLEVALFVTHLHPSPLVDC